MKITALDREEITSWNYDGSGNPGSLLVGNAIQVWAIAQDRDVTNNEAALAFNVAPELVREAVGEHPWMYLDANDVIQHDGE